MARLREGTLGSFTTAAAGSAVDISNLEEVYAYVAGTFTGTVAIQVSFDAGSTWVTHQTKTGPGLSTLLPPAGRVRANVTGYTTGTVEVRYGGRDNDRLE